MPQPLSALLLASAPNNRHGLTLQPQTAHLSKSDVQDVFHVGVPASIEEAWRSASGGVGTSQEAATLAAIGESIERYAATVVSLPLRTMESLKELAYISADEFSLFSSEQRAQKNFPFEGIYQPSCLYTNAYDLFTNKEVWVPHPLVALRDDYATGVPTSSGLAAAETSQKALLRSMQELIERDALMVTWLHALTGRRIELPVHLQKPANDLGAEVFAFDLTPVYSPFPVIAVAGGIKKDGAWRYSLGVACRETVLDATEKAYLEWCQGVFFAGIYPQYASSAQLQKPEDANSFDDHAMYYTLHPEQWNSLPLFNKVESTYTPILNANKSMTTNQALKKAITALKKANIRMYYRGLSTIDSVQAGVYIMRTLSPDLAPIFAHQSWPYIGGTIPKVHSRYPWAPQKTHFPNPMPHPLG